MPPNMVPIVSWVIVLIVEGGVGTAAVEEAVLTPQRAVAPDPDDLARAVDAVCKGAVGSQGVIKGGVGATAFEEAVEAGGVLIEADDLVQIVLVPVLAEGSSKVLKIWSGMARAPL
jgi:hypothetical protein